MQEEDYPGAIQLCLECQKAASTYRHYTCIRQVSGISQALHMHQASIRLVTGITRVSGIEASSQVLYVNEASTRHITDVTHNQANRC